jgi:hypothetical protein
MCGYAVLCYVCCAVQPPAVDVFWLTPRNVKLQRPSLFEWVKTSPTAFDELSRLTFSLIQSGKLKVRARVCVYACHIGAL